MWVLPVSRPVRPAAAPAFSRILAHWLEAASDPLATAADAPATARTPALDVRETDTAYELSLDLPGVARDRVKVSVLGRRVSVESVPAAAAPGEDTAAAPLAARVLYSERSQVPYARTVSLPSEVDSDAAQARFDNGVLTLTVPKRHAAAPIQVPVR